MTANTRLNFVAGNVSQWRYNEEYDDDDDDDDGEMTRKASDN